MEATKVKHPNNYFLFSHQTSSWKICLWTSVYGCACGFVCSHVWRSYACAGAHAGVVYLCVEVGGELWVSSFNCSLTWICLFVYLGYCFSDLFLFILCASVLCLYEGVGSVGTGAPDSFELLWGSWELNLSPVAGKAFSVLTVWQSLQPVCLSFDTRSLTGLEINDWASVSGPRSPPP